MIVSDYPTFFWGPLAHVRAMCIYQALSPPLEGPGYKASTPCNHREYIIYVVMYS